ncbi:MAG: response regulator, partial [Nitrososphaeraceae archaeon]
MKILIAEDELQTLRVLIKRLEQEGFVINSAKDGKMCLSLINTYEYDCIILDIMMPFINGLSILQSIMSKKIN